MKTIFILLLSFFSLISFSQNGKREQVKAAKVAFITNELSLTSAESEKFWPLYNTFDDKQKSIRKDKTKGYLNRLDADFDENMTEKEAVTKLAQIESSEEELFNLRKKFITNLKTVLPAIKILKLKKAEEDFNRKLLKQYRAKKN
jgi:hypothetical protein